MAEVFPISNGTADKGAQGELIAAAWLLGLGYQVFRNVAPCGPVDIVAWLAGSETIHLIDVKAPSSGSIYRRADGEFTLPIGKPVDGVHKLIISDGKPLGFARQTPAGAEFYWPLECDERKAEILPTGTWRDRVAARRRA